jgi:HEAT repeat protein
MPKRSLEDQIAELKRAVRGDPHGEPARAALRHALESKQSLIASAACEAIAEHELDGFAAGLGEVFERFLDNPVKRDPFCRAKTAALRALYRTNEGSTSLFLRGIRTVQLEPVWGGSQDTAVELRGLSALGLVRAGYPDAMAELADLLADPEPMARVAAAQAIAYGERADAGVPLLRFKARSGDADVRVMSACFGALLALAPEGSLPLVAEFARGRNPELREAALLALGDSRSHAALPLLVELAAHAAFDGEAAVALLAIALLRSDAAWDHLLGLVREGSPARARAAIDALATYREDPSLRERVIAAVQARGDAGLRAHAQAALDRGR